MNLPAETQSMRHELKYVLSPERYYELHQELRLSPAGFWQIYPSRKIHNIYFDTHDLRAFDDNIAGISERLKVRYRWYGQELQPQAGTLEIKRKRNAFGWKDSFAIPEFAPEDMGSWQRLRGHIAAHLPDPARQLFIETPQPVLVNRYIRDYYVCHNRRIRVTVDRDLGILDQRFASRPNWHRVNHRPPVIIMEVKYPAGAQEEARQVMAKLPLTLTRYSKYTDGLMSLADM